MLILLKNIDSFPEKDDRKKIYYKEENEEKSYHSNFGHYLNESSGENSFQYVPKPVCEGDKCNYESIIGSKEWNVEEQKQKMCDALRIFGRMKKLEGIDGHLTLKIPHDGDGETFDLLIDSFGVVWHNIERFLFFFCKLKFAH